MTFFATTAHSATYHTATGLVRFSATFNQAPDFQNADHFGYQMNSFQFFIVDPTKTLPADYPDYFQAIVRGEEIHHDNTIRVRGRPYYADGVLNEAGYLVGNGGWGGIVAEVSYSLVGNTITFDVPLADVAPNSPSGSFAYWYCDEQSFRDELVPYAYSPGSTIYFLPDSALTYTNTNVTNGASTVTT